VCVCDVVVVVQSGKKRINVCVFMLFFFVVGAVIFVV
jgi:hypothetical protein